MTKVKLSDHFTYKKLFRFVLAPIFMMVFTSIYGVIDGFFISNYAKETAFSAINLIYPFIMILGSVGFMIGAGGTAVISKLLGENKKEDANKYFSLLIYVTIICGIVFACIGIPLVPYISKLFKATEDMLPYCISYGQIVLIAIPFFMLQNVFQTFFSTAEKPLLGFIITVLAGCTNIVLDWILVGIVDLNVNGAAIATCISQVIGAVLPIAYFSLKNKSLLRLGKPKFNINVLFRTCSNGLSEFVSNVSACIISIVFNAQLMSLIGENGVSAYGVMMYVNFIYVAVFIGYSIGTAPIIGYNYGSNNKKELHNIYKKSLFIMGSFGVIMTLLALALAHPISKLYVGYNEELFQLTKNAFYIFSFSFVFSGFSIFASSMFTALGNGIISAVISFLRTLVFQLACVYILPLILGVNGIWLSMLIAEILSTLVAVILCITQKKKYGY